MVMVVKISEIYLLILTVLSFLYIVRHLVFSFNRLLFRQRMYYADIQTSDLPTVSVLVPMHNEELVLHNVLDALLRCDYDREKLEIIPINDHSEDNTQKIIDQYAAKYDIIRPIERRDDNSVGKGKPVGLNDAMKVARGDIIVVFDADYRPATDLLRQLALAFEDPGVGAVMGRVIPYNTGKNLLTRLLNMERSGGYQVDQQARYNLNLIPQYGGTVGGFRKDVMLETGGFAADVLAEDTELTYRLFTRGYRVVYANSAECYEESPETYKVRSTQIRRWSRGHNQVLFRYFGKTLRTPHLTCPQKMDAIMLLLVYMMPFLFLIGRVASLVVFFANGLSETVPWIFLLFLGVYASFGNFAPFFQIGTALFLDGIEGEILLLPLLIFHFYFYMWYISMGFLDAVIDGITHRNVKWAKTQRFADQDVGTEEEEKA